MREYGRINTQFWTDDKIQRLTDNGRLMMIYLLTGPHTNSIGCFRLPSGYIEADFGWDAETVTETLSELLREGLIVRGGGKTGWTLIANFLKHNPIENPNVGKAAMPFIDAVPRAIEFYPQFIATLEPYAERFPRGYINGLSNGSLNGLDNGMPNGMANREPEPEPNPEPEPESDSLVDPVAATNGSDNGFSLTDIDIKAALMVWNDLASELGLAQVQKLTDARKAKLRARLKDTEGIAGWAAVLIKIRESRFLRGEGKNGWRADFDFVLRESSFNKLREGVYGDKVLHEPPPIAFKLPPDMLTMLKGGGFSEVEIKRWFDDAAFFDGGKRITVKTPFMKDWIGDHYGDKLRRAIGSSPTLEVANG